MVSEADHVCARHTVLYVCVDALLPDPGSDTMLPFSATRGCVSALHCAPCPHYGPCCCANNARRSAADNDRSVLLTDYNPFHCCSAVCKLIAAGLQRRHVLTSCVLILCIHNFRALLVLCVISLAEQPIFRSEPADRPSRNYITFQGQPLPLQRKVTEQNLLEIVNYLFRDGAVIL